MRKPTYLLVRTKIDATPGMTCYIILTADAYEQDGEHITNNTIGWMDTPRRYLDHLQVRAQADSAQSDMRFYGAECEYADVMFVGEGKAKAMASTLGALHRRLSLMDAQLGYPEHVAAYLARVATALGAGSRPFLRHARSAAEMEELRPGYGPEHADTCGFVSMDAGTLRDWLNTQLAAFAKAYGKVER